MACDRLFGRDSVSMLFLDPPQHTRVRAAFARAFTPASLMALRPRIELICRKRLDRVHRRGQMELIADLAYPLPVLVIVEMLGFPPEDYEKFKRWSDDMTASLALNATSEQHATAAEARNQLRTYFDQVVVPMRNRPADSLISRLLETEGQPGGLNRGGTNRDLYAGGALSSCEMDRQKTELDERPDFSGSYEFAAGTWLFRIIGVIHFLARIGGRGARIFRRCPGAGCGCRAR
jgi:hypothetical protein